MLTRYCWCSMNNGQKYGIPTVRFTGKVTASAIGRKMPGLAFGAASFMAAGTAMYEALAARTESRNLFPGSSVTRLLKKATKLPLMSGMTTANKAVNHPLSESRLISDRLRYPCPIKR